MLSIPPLYFRNHWLGDAWGSANEGTIPVVSVERVLHEPGCQKLTEEWVRLRALTSVPSEEEKTKYRLVTATVLIIVYAPDGSPFHSREPSIEHENSSHLYRKLHSFRCGFRYRWAGWAV